MRLGSIVYLKSEPSSKRMTIIGLSAGGSFRVAWQDKSGVMRFAVLPERSLAVLVY